MGTLKVTRDLKFKFLQFVKDNGYDNGEVISNIDDESKKWFYVQVGKNEVEDCFHLELTEECKLEFHIETKEIISKFDCEKAFDYFKTLPEFSDFDFKKGGWNYCIKGYFAPYKINSKDFTENDLFSAILTTLPKIDGIITGYSF